MSGSKPPSRQTSGAFQKRMQAEFEAATEGPNADPNLAITIARIAMHEREMEREKQEKNLDRTGQRGAVAERIRKVMKDNPTATTAEIIALVGKKNAKGKEREALRKAITRARAPE
jgi:hypothetical protein